jgi:hypothetical protein
VSCLLVALMSLVGASCARTGGSGASGTSGGSPDYVLASDLGPEKQYSEKAKLAIGRTMVVPVKVFYERAGTDLVVSLRAYEENFEQETYRLDGTTFQLINAAGETYEPPIQLLKFPLTLGDNWKWTGKMISGGEPRPAQADVSTSKDRLLLASGAVDSVLVQVQLKFESGGPTVAERRLSFWFVPGKGMAQRAFGDGSKREPVE